MLLRPSGKVSLMRRMSLLLAGVTGLAALAATASPVVVADASTPSPAGLPAHPGTVQVLPGETSPSQIFDQSDLPLQAGIAPGVQAGKLLHPKIDLGTRTPIPVSTGGSGASNGAELPATSEGTAAPAAPRDPEILGFAQVGEVTSGDWQSDFRLADLTTIAYDSLNLNTNGTVIEDSGYQGWWSAQMTSLINAAHSAGDRVVLTITMDNSSIETLVGSESNRQTAITNIVEQLESRGGDGVNLDFEGLIPAVVPSDYTTFVGELQYALRTLVPTQSYLTVDTYASAAQGGTMMDISALRPYVDAFDVMDYDVDYGQTLPNDPLNPVPYTAYSDSQVVKAYLSLVPGYQIILGIPYYGYVYSTTGEGFNAPRGGDGDVSAVTYSGILADFACTTGAPDNLQGPSWDTPSETPWAAWTSPASGATPPDPCGGNHGSDRELYYDNAQSLGDKYALVNSDGLRGIGIWALGYDSGSSDLWNAITQSFSVAHGASTTPTAPGPGVPVGLGGGPLGGAPQAVSWGPNFDDVFWEGTDGGLWHMWEVDGQWYGPASLSRSGVMASNPSVVSWGAGEIDVFFKGTDGGLWHAYYGSGSWHAAQDLGMGPLGSPPEAVTWGPGDLDVFWAGTGSPSLWHAYYSSGWHGPVQMPGVSTVAGTPYPVSWGPGNEEVFWKGTDGSLWQDYYVNGWVGPGSLGFGGLGSDPQPMTFGTGLLDVFWRTTGGGVSQAYYANGWHGTYSLGASAVSSLPDPVEPSAGDIDVFWEDTSANLDHAFYAGGWYGPFLVGDGPMGSAPSVASWGNGHMDIFWKGTDGNLWTASFSS
jgi:hypothetical protein